MDDPSNQIADSQAPSPAKRGGYTRVKRGSTRGFARGNYRGRASGRGRGGGRGRGRGGRPKVYDDPRVQAAYERQKELRELYAEVTTVIKPGLDKLADDTLNNLLEDPNYHQGFDAHDEINHELDDLVKKLINRAHLKHETMTATTKMEYGLKETIARQKYENVIEYARDEFHDGAMNRAGIIAECQREAAGVNVPDVQWQYVQVPDLYVERQGPPALRFGDTQSSRQILQPEVKQSNLRTTSQLRKKPGPKRKAEDQLENQPEAKKLPGTLKVETNIEGSSTPRPRHIGGLLSAENEPDGETESRVPSSSPIEDSPTREIGPKRSGSRTINLPDLPAGASEPDIYGVRIVHKRGPKANNRIIIPPLFEFDDDEIGFRDSTNDSTRKATRATRGKLLDQPNSRTWHLDQTIAYYNCLDYEDGALDPVLVQKHGLHPKYGFFLPTSVNEAVPPSEIVPPKPIVLITPNKTTLHTSRSVRPMLADRAQQADSRRAKMRTMLRRADQEYMAELDNMSSRQIEESKPEVQLDVKLEPEPEPELASASASANMKPVPEEPTIVDGPETRQSLSLCLQAAEQVDSSEKEVVKPRVTRSYDAVRDVFGARNPHSQRQPSLQLQPGQYGTPKTPKTPEAPDTSKLHALASAVEQKERVSRRHTVDVPIKREVEPFHGRVTRQSEHRRREMERQQQQTEQMERTEMAERTERARIERATETANFQFYANPSVVDPRLFDGHNPPLIPATAPPATTFLQTALNPTSPYAPIAPAPSHHMDSSRSQTPSIRNPFSTSGSDPTNPPLPPLRPHKREKLVSHETIMNNHEESPMASYPIAPQLYSNGMSGQPGPPGPHGGLSQFSVHLQDFNPMSHGMLSSSAGGYYQPPPMRGYHHNFPVNEQTMMTVHNQQYPIPGTGILHTQPQNPAGAPTYQVLSPPLVSQTQMAPMPSRMGPSPPPISTGSLANSPDALSPISMHGLPQKRGSASSASQNGKLRKLAAAPVPGNRSWQTGNGPELRLSNYDPKDAIKDYKASEPTPRGGPTAIRGWSVNNAPRGRKGKKEEQEDRDSPK